MLSTWWIRKPDTEPDVQGCDATKFNSNPKACNMKLIDNKVFLTFQEMVQCGFSENTLKDAKRTGARCWKFMDDPEDKRKVLVSYEDLKPEYKRKVDERFGNVYDQVARLPILELVVNDAKAVEWFKGFRYDGGTKYLDIQTVNKYVRAAAWLVALGCPKLKNRVKTELKIKLLTEFFIHAGDLIAQEKGRGKLDWYMGADQLPGDFPGSYQRLMARVAAFAEVRRVEGESAAWATIVDARFENKNAAKLGKVSAGSEERRAELPTAQGLLASAEEVRAVIYAQNGGESDQKSANKGGAFDPELYGKQEALILYLLGLHNNLDCGQVCKIAKSFFKQNGWKPVSVGTIRRIKKENADLITAGSRGERVHKDKIAMQVKRAAPKWPLLFWSLDGWMAELQYREYVNGKWIYGRMMLEVVLDPCEKYPIGYAIGDGEDGELISAACRNAMGHVKELFGENYKPWQVQSDNFGKKSMMPFYEAMTKLYTPAQVGNAKAKPVEPYLMYLNKNYCQLMNNWSGFNMDANRDNQVNQEWQDKNKVNFPNREGVIKQLHWIMAKEREAKREAYMAKWELMQQESPKDMPVVLGDMDYITVFGQVLGDKTSRIVGQGIIKQVNGVQYVYDSFDPGFRQQTNMKWVLTGIMGELDKVVASSPDGKIKYLLEEKRILPMDARSMTQDDWGHKTLVEQYNSNVERRVKKGHEDRWTLVESVVNDTPYDAELALKMKFITGGQQKVFINAAKQGQLAVDSRQLGAERRREEREQAKDEQVLVEDWDAQRRAYLNGVLNND